jgi:hypothetical protein
MQKRPEEEREGALSNIDLCAYQKSYLPPENKILLSILSHLTVIFNSYVNFFIKIFTFFYCNSAQSMLYY